MAAPLRAGFFASEASDFAPVHKRQRTTGTLLTRTWEVFLPLSIQLRCFPCSPVPKFSLEDAFVDHVKSASAQCQTLCFIMCNEHSPVSKLRLHSMRILPCWYLIPMFLYYPAGWILYSYLGASSSLSFTVLVALFIPLFAFLALA